MTSYWEFWCQFWIKLKNHIGYKLFEILVGVRLLDVGIPMSLWTGPSLQITQEFIQDHEA